MAFLGNPAVTSAVIEKYGIRAQKKYGQNFLIDENILKKIADASGVTKEDLVLEIGPGIGTLTQILCEKAGVVVAVEIDKKLIPVLEDTLSEYDNVKIVNADILKCDLDALIEEYGNYERIKVVANLPYYITTPVLMRILESDLPLSSVTVMIQKEVADRIKAGPSTKDYGSLSLAVQYYSRPSIAAEVSPSCFIPRPGVGSVVLHLSMYDEKPVKTKDPELMFALIRGSFNQRRKTLVNGLKNYAGLDYSKEEIEEAIERLGKKPAVRGEELTLEEFAGLADILGSIRF
ncbi:MAG: 16S rRNA (adenine(1518)-N(6)/adenine(1519)-N(6))-dimethyltransferase RsmA [Lachnospiraceae bacterium]|nr:16S rRNA (adenine(1518)-N(6)/adenine(1519)-N(6))-dimethyltransferase RsmA [Lachnospiraceae bacterium]